MKKQIIGVFTNLKELKEDGIWFDGIENKGEFKSWWGNGQLWIHCFYRGVSNNKENRYRGEFKLWLENGELIKHRIYNDDGSLKEKIV